MGQRVNARKARKVVQAIAREEVQRAEIDLMVRCGAVLFQRDLLGRLRWLFLGK